MRNKFAWYIFLKRVNIVKVVVGGMYTRIPLDFELKF